MLTILATIILIGVMLWAVNALIPMEPTVKRILNVVTIVCLAVWLLHSFGLLHGNFVLPM